MLWHEEHDRIGGRRRFADRVAAGRQLAVVLEQQLVGIRGQHPIVVGVPRGGVIVGAEVAAALEAPFDVVLVRKLSTAAQPELAIGAIGEDAVRILHRPVLEGLAVSATELAAIEARERAELERRSKQYRRGRPAIPVAGRTVIVVDDGVATGSTARVACRILRAHGARRVVLAVPVAAPDWALSMGTAADDYVAAMTPSSFRSVGEWYADFTQTTDDEVVDRLAHATSV